MSASTKPSLKAQFEEEYAPEEPSIQEAPLGSSCDIGSCNDITIN